jgi:exonuclease VII small subunit
MQRSFLTLMSAAAMCGIAGSAMAQAQSPSQPGASAGTSSAAGATAPTNYSQSMARLQQAAQKLREAVQAMAQQPPGPRRDAAAQQAREAIVETQGAMVALPPELRTGSNPGAGVNYTASMARLQEAAQRLREAVQAMAQQPAGAGRNAAVLQANQALFDTQQAMLQLPPDLRTGKTP